MFWSKYETSSNVTVIQNVRTIKFADWDCRRRWGGDVTSSRLLSGHCSPCHSSSPSQYLLATLHNCSQFVTNHGIRMQLFAVQCVCDWCRHTICIANEPRPHNIQPHTVTQSAGGDWISNKQSQARFTVDIQNIHHIHRLQCNACCL